ncbi:hypothetical protein MHBO_000353 [Bonamia ostreae]|uniref:Uncharacterized protein n=1 Tax=Bonamia ostreae TaxID=126728 RepID=A0ABV2AGK9_9EUKA
MRNKKVGLTLYRPIRLTDMYLDEDNNLVIAIADVVFDDDRKVLFEIERNSLIATLNNFNGIMNCTLDHFSHYLEYIKILTSHSWELTNHELFTQLGENNYSAMFSFIKDDTLHCMQLKNKSVPPVVCKTKLENRNHFDMIIPSSDNENIYVKIIDVEDELYSKYGCFITDLCLGKELCGKYCIYYLDSNRFNYIQTFLHKHEDQLVKKVVIKRENSSRQLTFAGIPQLFMEKVFSFMTKFPMAKSMNWEEHSKSLVSTSEGLLKDKSHLQNLEQKYKVNLTRLMLYLMDKMPAHGLFLGEPLHTQDLSITDEGYLQATAFAFTATSMNHYDNVVKSLENLQSMFGHLQEFDQLMVSAKLYSSTEKLLELPFFVKGKLNANPRIAAMVCPSFLILVFGGETMLISYQNQKAILQEKIQINDTKYLLQVYPVDTFNKLELCLDQVAHYETSQKFVVLLNTLY